MATVKRIKNPVESKYKFDASFFLKIFVKKIEDKWQDSFIKTMTYHKKLEASGACVSCEYGKEFNNLLKLFIPELKSLSKDLQKEVIEEMGTRNTISFNKNWINLETNKVTKIEYEDVERNINQNAIQKKVKTVTHDNKKRKIIFKNKQCPGDIVMLTAAVRDLHRNHPNKFITGVDTNCMPLWENNPYVSNLDPKDSDVEVIDIGYDLIQKSNQGPFHFSEGFTQDMEDRLGIRIFDRIAKGDIYTGPQTAGWAKGERENFFRPYNYNTESPYWILNAGYKNDFTAKMWSSDNYQAVIDHFTDRIQFVQVGLEDPHHNHPQLDNVINLIGKTDDRQIVRLIWGSSGVLTPVSFAMTLAAAIPTIPEKCNGLSNRPCVVIAGGREPSRWQAHGTHQFVHTCGMLPCCNRGACWKSRVYPIGDGDDKDKRDLCDNVVISESGSEMPYCMWMIKPEDIIRRIEMYLEFFEPDRQETFNHNGKS